MMAMTKPKGPLCKVCGDEASGFHYGVDSCEGCKVSNFKFALGIALQSDDIRCLLYILHRVMLHYVLPHGDGTSLGEQISF